MKPDRIVLGKPFYLVKCKRCERETLREQLDSECAICTLQAELDKPYEPPAHRYVTDPMRHDKEYDGWA